MTLSMFPCQLVWQEAEVGKLDTSRNLRNLPILTCARRFKRRAQVKIGGLGGLRCLACESYSPTRRARGGKKMWGIKSVSGRVNRMCRWTSSEYTQCLLPKCLESNEKSITI